MAWSTTIDGKDYSATSEQMAWFRDLYVPENLSDRVADLFIFDLFVLDAAFGVSPHEIMDSIKKLESGKPDDEIKPPTKFNHPPLKGLWHRHYFSAHFLLKNMALALGKNGLERIIREELPPTKPVITQEMINQIAHRVTHEPIEQRAADGKLTGEWIIFVKHQGSNYYLGLNTHDAGDAFIFDQIMRLCPQNFPDLKDWISASAAE